MTGGALTILAVAGSGSLWNLPEALTSGRFLVRHATYSGAESWLKDTAFDVVLVWMDRCTEELPGVIKSWKAMRPQTQFFLFLEQTPPTRALISLMHSGCQDVLDQSQATDGQRSRGNRH